MNARPLLACLCLVACAGSKPAPEAPPPAAPTPVPDQTRAPARPPVDEAQCNPTGCSGTVCADEDITTTCEYRAEYACYAAAACERQDDGSCGWTRTPELQACLENPPPIE